MCGIAGWVSARDAGDGQATLDRMTDSLAHRGPDDRGTWSGGGAWLGHRRLAVIDPSPAGRQPMTLRELALVFNGEIYNYRSMRAELESLRRVFTTQTDTEVLLHGYATWGLDGLLERADGMFALALWDGRRGQLHLARDRMGEKPLYYAHLTDGTLVFGSELRAVLAHPDVPRDIDPVSLRKYLAYDFVPAPRAMIAGVRKVEAGALVTWKAGAIERSARWWDLPAPPVMRLTTPDDAALALWTAVEGAVRSRLVADVPVGVFLSGGLDSSAIAVAACGLRSSVDTFTVGFDDPSFDESGPARAVARHLGTRHHEERLTAASMIDLVPHLIVDEPLADPSVVPTSLLARFTRGHVKVALGGDGGDELFLGYPTFGVHGAAKLAASLPSAFRERILSPLVAALPVSDANWSLDFRLKRFVAGLDLGPFARHFAWIGGTHPSEHAALLEPSIHAAAGAASPFDDVDRLAAGRTGEDLDVLSYLYAKLYLGEGVLQKVDRATMRHGLESRAPFLAPEVVRVATALDSSLKLRGRSTKWILRHALRGRLPASILERPKKGFGMPLTAWLRGPLLPLCRDLLDATALRRQAIFRAERCEKLIAEHLAGWRDHRKTLWAVMVFQLWSRSLAG